MKRTLRVFENKTYDVIVVGGGVYGAFVAWEAALRGLSVALFEQGDFGAATSANSLKVIHGGLRYLQRAEIGRFRASAQERDTLLAVAPHLVKPMPVVIPAYGHGMRGREAMQAAAVFSNFIARQTHSALAKDVQLPKSRVISRGECMELFPDLPREGLTGGLLTYDAQAISAERLVLSVLQSAVFRGADVANYARVIGFQWRGDVATGVTVHDEISGNELNVTGKMIINTAGPWVASVLKRANVRPTAGVPPFARAVNLIVRDFLQDHAIGLTARPLEGPAAAGGKADKRMLFAAPWRATSMIGTGYYVSKNGPDQLGIQEEEICDLLARFNRAYPAAKLTREDVRFTHIGLMPLDHDIQDGAEPVPARQCRLFDHRHDGIQGAITVVGEKFTTARRAAEQVVDHVFTVWGKQPPPSRSAVTPLHDGHIDNFDHFASLETATLSRHFPPEEIRMLSHDYGTAIGRVLLHCDTSQIRRPYELARTDLLRARVRYGVAEEAAQHLTDVVFRRTGLGTTGYPGEQAINVCAHEMADLCGWDDRRMQDEIDDVMQYYAAKGTYVLTTNSQHAAAPVRAFNP